jgi:predicted  nucleic acid-binding Zn-ribbon protein
MSETEAQNQLEKRVTRSEERIDMILSKVNDVDKKVGIFEETTRIFAIAQDNFAKTLKEMEHTLTGIDKNMFNMLTQIANLNEKIDKVDVSTKTEISDLNKKVDANDEKGKIDIVVELKKHWLAIALGIVALLSNVDKIKMALRIP